MAIEIKGIISHRGEVNLTCCSIHPDIYLDNVSLKEFIEDKFNIDPGVDSESSLEYKVRYVIMEPTPKYETFEELASKVIISKFDGTISGEFMSGCYSEYTCGVGGFDFECHGCNQSNVICNTVYGTEKKNTSHNLFTELQNYVGKYAHIKFTD